MVSLALAASAAFGVALIAYGRAMHRAGMRGRLYLVWCVAGAAFVISAAGTALAPAGSTASVACRGCLVALAALTLAFIVASLFLMAQGRRAASGPFDWIVVLGARVRADGTPSITLRKRLETARAYLAGHPATRVVVSGGQGPDEPASEAAVMRAWLIERGVDPARIAAEDRSTTTAENVAGVLPLIPRTARAGIVTSDFHLFRAMRLARRGGLPCTGGIPAPTRLRYLPHNLLRECAAVVKNALLGRM